MPSLMGRNDGFNIFPNYHDPWYGTMAEVGELSARHLVVGGWLGSYGGEDSPNDISCGLFAVRSERHACCSQRSVAIFPSPGSGQATRWKRSLNSLTRQMSHYPNELLSSVGMLYDHSSMHRTSTICRR